MTPKEAKARILVVDDSVDTLEVIRRSLSFEGYQVFTAPGAPEAIHCLEQEPVDLVITDLKMPRVSGLDLVRHVRENYRDTEVVMITGFASVGSAVEAIKAGAEEYLAKPFTESELLTAVRNAMDKLSIRNAGRAVGETPPAQCGLIGGSPAMQTVFSAISKAAPTHAAVLITGEDRHTFAMDYVRWVERTRQDLIVVDGELWQQPWYAAQNAARHPELHGTADLDLPRLIAAVLARGVPVYLANRRESIAEAYPLVPQGNLWQIGVPAR